ncbi:MAG: c-type cytochrome [Gammaproteobacteria bacterium]|nr:c-type cytochrome [Gammaproteobacteria bacterium]
MKSTTRLLACLLLLLSVGACSTGAQSGQSTLSNLPFANDIVDEAVMGKWARSCALCHVDGEAGAPLVGDQEEWQLRLAQGEDILLRNVLEGVNSMPPLGYCMACEIADFRAMIGFMAGTSQESNR